jgi:hypothetical protein
MTAVMILLSFLRLFAFQAAALESPDAFEDFADFSEFNEFYVAVDYYSETIRILHPNSLLARYGARSYMEIYDNDSVIAGITASIGKSDLAKNISVAHDGEYMFALRAVSDDALQSFDRSGRKHRKIAALMREKWYPIYGGGIDISRVIPVRAARNPRNQYYIAIRRADDIFNSETGYESRVSVRIKPRFGERNLSRFIEYDASNEKIILSRNYTGGNYLNIIYRYDFFDPISGTLTKDGADAAANIDVPARLFSAGGTVSISTMPSLRNGPYGPEVEFARSAETKVRIPRIPALPAIRADLSVNRLVSIRKDTLEWSLTGAENTWRPYEKSETTLSFGELLATFAGLDENNIDRDGNYAIYFRTTAIAGRSPASPPKKILIPAELCG